MLIKVRIVVLCGGVVLLDAEGTSGVIEINVLY